MIKLMDLLELFDGPATLQGVQNSKQKKRAKERNAEKHAPGKVWKTHTGWGAKNKSGTLKYFKSSTSSEATAKKFANT